MNEINVNYGTSCVHTIIISLCTRVHMLFLSPSLSPAEGMKALREQNIVHRDLKPGNILIKHHPHTKKMQVREGASYPKLVICISNSY